MKNVQTLKTISLLIGNIDHSKGHGENSARMRGQLLNNIRDIINKSLKEEDEYSQIKEIITQNTGGNFMVDFIELKNGKVLAISCECACLYPSMEDAMETGYTGDEETIYFN